MQSAALQDMHLWLTSKMLLICKGVRLKMHGVARDYHAYSLTPMGYGGKQEVEIVDRVIVSLHYVRAEKNGSLLLSKKLMEFFLNSKSIIIHKVFFLFQ